LAKTIQTSKSQKKEFARNAESEKSQGRRKNGTAKEKQPSQRRSL
jgi:hypothetical protein